MAWIRIAPRWVTATLAFVYETFPWLGYQAVGLIELFAVLLIAIYLGRGPALVDKIKRL